MKKLLLATLIFSVFCISSNINAQSAVGIPHYFNFQTGSQPLFPFSGSVVITPSNFDDWDTLIDPGGFNFTFAGISYTKFVASTNGWVALIPSAVSVMPPSLSSALPVNDLSNNPSGFPILAPFWDDLVSGVFRYKIDSNVIWVSSDASAFYLKLDGNLNTISFYYHTLNTSSQPSASIGITGICEGDFYSVGVSSMITPGLDSLTENDSIGGPGGLSVMPHDCSFSFAPSSPYDNCSFPKLGGTISGAGSTLNISNINSTAGGPGNCNTSDVNDVWISFYKPANVSDVKISTLPDSCPGITGTSMEVYDSCGGILIDCSISSVSYPGYAESTFLRPCSAENLYVRLTSDGDLPGKFIVHAVDMGATLLWNGTVDSNFTLDSNWVSNACSGPLSCMTDVRIPSNAIRPAIITANAQVHDIIIDAGASLTINPACTLDVCGNFTNYGSLITYQSSVIRFVSTEIQSINGSLVNSNQFGSLEISKNAGEVILQSDIDIKGNFRIASGTSVINFNGHYMKVGGHFTNYNNFTTYNIPLSTIEFNGNYNQYYTNTNGNDTLNRVTINKPSGKVYLTGSFGSMNIDSVLNLTSGNIVTANTNEVNVKWGNVSAIANHSSGSFIEGRLRRKIYLGAIDFPVGDLLVPNQGGLNGYELATVTFTSSTVISNLLAWFSAWPSVPPAGPSVIDNCATYFTTYDSLPILDNGYWTFQRPGASFNGAYNLTLFNTGGTNATGTYWSIATADISSNPLNSSSWSMSGTCVGTSTFSIDERTQYNIPASSSTSFNQFYAAVQSNSFISEVRNIDGDDFSIYPNPASDVVKIEWTGHEFDVFIYDMTGRKIIEEKGIQSNVLIEYNFSPGVYLVSTVERSGSVMKRKIVVE